MTDHLTPKKRSWNMSQIRSKNTNPELIIRKALHRLGFRFRLHNKLLPGKPDIVMKKHHTIIFCHGCFWHQHKNCNRATLPKSNVDYWENKLKRNVKRFNEVKIELTKLGWKVLVIWECETKNSEFLSIKLVKIIN